MKSFLLLIAISFSFCNILLGQYCYPSTQNLLASHQIQYFQLGEFINITPDTDIQEYNDFSDSLIINIVLGQEYDLVISKGPNPYAFMAGNTLGYSIWIDFNSDTIFSENELIYSEYYDSAIYTYVDTISFNDFSLNGVYRLRLRNEWGRKPDSACDILWGGETEDYSINFINEEQDPEIPIGSEGIMVTVLLIAGVIVLRRVRLETNLV